MKTWLKKCLTGILIAAICLTGIPVGVQAATTKNTLSALHVEGTKLCDKDGNVVQLRGVSTHGLSWYPQYVNDKCFKDLHDKWGANVVRLAMYTEEYNGYCSGDANNRKQLKALVKKGVKLAAKNDLYVIIDWHILSDGNPKKHVKASKAFFKEMSKTFKDYDNVLYEICNEPNGGTDWKTIKSYAKSVIPVIRKNDKDAIIIVGTPNWSQKVDEAAASPSGYGGIDKKEAVKWIKVLNKRDISYVAWNVSNKDEGSAMIKSSCAKTSGLKRSDLSTSGKWVYDLLRKHKN